MNSAMNRGSPFRLSEDALSGSFGFFGTPQPSGFVSLLPVRLARDEDDVPEVGAEVVRQVRPGRQEVGVERDDRVRLRLAHRQPPAPVIEQVQPGVGRDPLEREPRLRRAPEADALLRPAARGPREVEVLLALAAPLSAIRATASSTRVERGTVRLSLKKKWTGAEHERLLALRADADLRSLALVPDDRTAEYRRPVPDAGRRVEQPVVDLDEPVRERRALPRARRLEPDLVVDVERDQVRGS